MHLVVELGLGLIYGFRGLIDEGAEVVIVEDQAVLSCNGEPLRELAVDFSSLVTAEEAVALLDPKPVLESLGALSIARLAPDSFGPPASDEIVSHLGFLLPDGTTTEAINAIHSQLREFTQQFQRVQGHSITLTWSRHGNGRPATHRS